LGWFIVVFSALGTVERAIATISILSRLSFLGFYFFSSLLATRSFFAQLVREAIVWIAWVHKTFGTQMACLSTKIEID
jgi:hypothetical protein